MKLFTNTAFDGHYPVGVAALVLADNALEAAAMLNEQLKKHGLKPSAKEAQFFEVDMTVNQAIVLHDGNY